MVEEFNRIREGVQHFSVWKPYDGSASDRLSSVSGAEEGVVHVGEVACARSMKQNQTCSLV